MTTLAEFDLPTSNEIIAGLKKVSPDIFDYGDNAPILKEGADNITYGPYFKRLAQYGFELVKDQRMNPKPLGETLVAAAHCYIDANTAYQKNPNALKGDALEKHQVSILAGNINLVPPEAATSREQGQQMAKAADFYIGDHEDGRTSRQSPLAELNYGGFFKPQTMADAKLTRERGDIDKLLATIGKDPLAMPHVSLANYAIGMIVGGIYKDAAQYRPQQRLHIFDIGAGSGGTAVANLSCIANVRDIPCRPPLGYTAIETTGAFYNQLRYFAREDPLIRALDLIDTPYSPRDKMLISECGSFTTVKADARTALDSYLHQNIEKIIDRIHDWDTFVFTINYAWHRFGRRKREDMMRMCEAIPNAIFIICDLYDNTSEINRRSFNLSPNGPLNTGNLGLKESFKSKGYHVIDLDKEQPASLNPAVADRLRWTSINDDGHMCIAYSGRFASRSLNLVPVTN